MCCKFWFERVHIIRESEISGKGVPYVRGSQWESHCPCVSIVRVRSTQQLSRFWPKSHWWDIWHEVILQTGRNLSIQALENKKSFEKYPLFKEQSVKRDKYWCHVISLFIPTISLAEALWTYYRCFSDFGGRPSKGLCHIIVMSEWHIF